MLKMAIKRGGRADDVTVLVVDLLPYGDSEAALPSLLGPKQVLGHRKVLRQAAHSVTPSSKWSCTARCNKGSNSVFWGAAVCMYALCSLKLGLRKRWGTPASSGS